MVLRLQWFITINLQHGKCRIQRFYSFTFTGDEHISTCFDYKTYFSKNLFLTSPPTFMKVKDWIAHVLIRLATQYLLSYGRRYMENNWLCHFFLCVWSSPLGFMCKNKSVTNQDRQQFTVHSTFCVCRNRWAPITAVWYMRQGSQCVCLWFVIHHKKSSPATCMDLTLWSDTIKIKHCCNSLSSCLFQLWVMNPMQCLLDDAFTCAMLRLSWREVGCWNGPIKSSDVREAFKPLPVYWLVYRKSHGCCILHRVALCSDWAACE